MEQNTDLTKTTEAAGAAVEPSEAGTAVPQAPESEPTILPVEEPAAQDSVDDGAQGEVPETYVLEPVDGVIIDEEAVAVATPVFRELGLTNEQANRLVPVAARFAEIVSRRAQDEALANAAALRKEWYDAVMADEELGGSTDRLEKTRAIAARALDRFADAEFRSFLNETGLANHPAMVRMVYRIGQMLSEDQTDVKPSAASSADRQRIYDPAYYA